MSISDALDRDVMMRAVRVGSLHQRSNGFAGADGAAGCQLKRRAVG
jgi:hypothetical protein